MVKIDSECSEAPENDFFLQSKGIVPIKSDFKPQMVLSRRPAKPVEPPEAGNQPSNPNLDDEDEEDEMTKEVLTPEQRLQRAQQKREEKQRAYDERRRQLFGDETASAKAKSNYATTSPRNQSRTKGNTSSRPSSAAGNRNRQLFDANETPKPEALRSQLRGSGNDGMQPIREPKAPDGSGRGGFGFLPRGGRNSS